MIAIGPLTASLTDKESMVSTAAAEALGKFGAEAKVAVAPLMEALKDEKVWDSARALPKS